MTPFLEKKKKKKKKKNLLKKIYKKFARKNWVFKKKNWNLS
jgi:hypothetical protein